MIKEFEISDILNAVNSISKIKRKKDHDNNIELFNLVLMCCQWEGKDRIEPKSIISYINDII